MLLDQLYDDITKGTDLILGVTSQTVGDNVSTSSASSDTLKDNGATFFESFKVGSFFTLSVVCSTYRMPNQGFEPCVLDCRILI